MPVVGPVDLWMNYRFAELGALALTSPAIAQRHDGTSDNAYSVMPYLARAGIVDGRHGTKPPDVAGSGPLLAWTGGADRERLAMALSMLGLRVRAFDGHEEPLDHLGLSEALKTFDALVDPPLVPAALAAAVANERTLILLEANARTPEGLVSDRLPPLRSAVLTQSDSNQGSWDELCGLLAIGKPVEAFPAGAPREFRLFRDGRSPPVQDHVAQKRRDSWPMDDSPWVLPSSHRWRPVQNANRRARTTVQAIVEVSMTNASTSFPGLPKPFQATWRRSRPNASCIATMASESLSTSRKEGRVHIGQGHSRLCARSRTAAFKQKFGQRRGRDSSPVFFCIAAHQGKKSTLSSQAPIRGEC